MRKQSRSSVVWLVMAVVLGQASVLATDLAAREQGLHGFVCDDHGKPVTNARVEVNFRPVGLDSHGSFFLPHSSLEHDRTVLVTVETTFENPERNPPYRWEVNAARLLDYASGQENVTIRPRNPGLLGGRVLTTDGKPIAGAMISAHINVGLLTCHGTHRVRAGIQADAEGCFEINKLYSDSDYLLRIEAPDYERKWTEWIRVRPGVSPRMEIRLRSAPETVAGQVVDSKGKPLAKARVVMGHLCIPDAIAETDDEGRFRIGSLLRDQTVDLWSNGKSVKAKAGERNLLITVP